MNCYLPEEVYIHSTPLLITRYINEEAPSPRPNLTGCQAVRKLWEVALDCNVDKPKEFGMSKECKNLKQTMYISYIKCLEEMSHKSN